METAFTSGGGLKAFATHNRNARLCAERQPKATIGNWIEKRGKNRSSNRQHDRIKNQFSFYLFSHFPFLSQFGSAFDFSPFAHAQNAQHIMFKWALGRFMLFSLRAMKSLHFRVSFRFPFDFPHFRQFHLCCVCVCPWLMTRIHSSVSNGTTKPIYAPIVDFLSVNVTGFAQHIRMHAERPHDLNCLKIRQWQWNTMQPFSGFGYAIHSH